MVKLNSRLLAVLIIVAFVAGIGGTMAFNLWHTESTKVPRTITEGEFTGEADPGDIRGSYSFGDIEAAFGVPAEDLARAFGIRDTDAPAEFLCKELEDLYADVGDDQEIGTDAVRLFVASYLRMPHTPEESTVLPSFAFSVLKEKAGLSSEELEALQERRISITPGAPAADTEEEHEELKEDRSVRGNTTFNDLKTWGLSDEQIEGVLGMPGGASGVTVRNFVSAEGIEFSTVKTQFQELLDSQE